MSITFNKTPGMKVLELGGGDNPQPVSDCNVDLRPGDKVNFTADFNEPLPISDNEWDAVLSIFSAEHISWRKTKQFISEIHRILKPGGKVILVVPNTEAQLKHILDKSEPDGDESSMLYGDQNYNGNFHCSYWCPRSTTKLLQEVGFENILIRPYGEPLHTDMVVEAVRPALVSVNPVEQPKRNPALDVPRTELFDRRYFNGGHPQFGGYEGFAWDFPHHETTARFVLARRPESVLELGCGRSYVGKRIEDAGVRYQGIDISKHAEMTRVATNVVTFDLCEIPWRGWGRFPIEGHDLCFSCDVLDRIPEEFIPAISKEMERTCKRGLHGIDFGPISFDKTRVTIKDVNWWKSVLPKNHEVVDKKELEQGDLPPEYVKGDGKLKVAIGTFMTMHHQNWLNCDIIDLSQFAQANRYNFARLDARQGLPFGTGTVDLIFHSHFLEHISFSEGLSLCREARRIIKPTGAMRIIVPDAELLLSKCADNTISEYGELNSECAESHTFIKQLHSLLCANHESMYDWDTLKETLEESGWIPHKASFRYTKIPQIQQILRETLDMLPCLSLYVDAVPNVG